MSITGSTFFCSGSPVYRISGLPCNASVTWSSNPAGIVSISTNNNQATLTKLADGSTTLLATITSCGKTVTTSLPIQVGVPAPVQSITINGADPMSLCPNTTYAAIANPTVYAQYEWYLPNGWTAFNADSGPDPWVCYDYELDFQTDNYNSGSLAVRRVNNCGASDFTYLETAVNCGYYFYALSPNPAKDKVAIDGRKNDKSIKEVQVIDKSGNLKKTVKYSGKSTLVTLDVSGLSPGLYYLRIFNGQTWEGKPLSIQ